MEIKEQPTQLKLPRTKAPLNLPEPLNSPEALEKIAIDAASKIKLTLEKIDNIKLISEPANTEKIFSFSAGKDKYLVISNKIYSIENAPNEASILKYKEALGSLVTSINSSNTCANELLKKYPAHRAVIEQLVATTNPNLIKIDDSLRKEFEKLVGHQEDIRKHSEELRITFVAASTYTLKSLKPSGVEGNVILMKVPDRKESPWIAAYDSKGDLRSIEVAIGKLGNETRQTYSKQEIIDSLKSPNLPQNKQILEILRKEPYLAAGLARLWMKALESFDGENKEVAYKASELLHIAAESSAEPNRKKIINVLLAQSPNQSSNFYFYRQLLISENSSPLSSTHLGSAAFGAVDQVIDGYKNNKTKDHAKLLVSFFARYPDPRGLGVIEEIANDSKLDPEVTFVAGIISDVMKNRSIEGRINEINQKIVSDTQSIASGNKSFDFRKVLNSNSYLGLLAKPAISELIDSKSEILFLCGCILALKTKNEEMIYRGMNETKVISPARNKTNPVSVPKLFDVLFNLKTVKPTTSESFFEDSADRHQRFLDNKGLHQMFLEELKSAVDAKSPAARHLLILATNDERPWVRDTFQTLEVSKDRYVPGGEEVLADFRYSPAGHGVDIVGEAIKLRKHDGLQDWQIKALDRFIKTRKLGFDFPDRLIDRKLNEDWLEDIIKDSNTKPKLGQKVAVILSCKTDHNGALYNLGDRIAELKYQGYHTVYREVGSKEAFIAATQEISKDKKADILLIAGHSFQKMTFFGNPTWAGAAFLMTGDKKELIDAGVGSLLKDSGKIVLGACSVGQGKEEADNIANMMRAIFPQADKNGIWSMTKPGNIISIEFKDGILNKVNFTVSEEDTYRAALEEASPYVNLS